MTDQVAVMQLAVTEIRIVAVGFAVSPREVYYARENAPFERAGLSDGLGQLPLGLRLRDQTRV